MFRNDSGGFVPAQAGALSGRAVSVHEVDHVAVIETLLNKRTSGQNRLQRRINQAIFTATKLPEARDQNYFPRYMMIEMSTLRRIAEIPHQLELFESFDGG